MFISHHVDINLEMTTPPDLCCNCGARHGLEFIETPMKRVRFFFFFGTELTLTEHFPYCPQCVKSAARIRSGWFGKALSACMVTGFVFLAFLYFADAFPQFLKSNLFSGAVVFSIVLTLLFYYLLDWGRKGRTWFQPVSLVKTESEGGHVSRFYLRFYNPEYAALFARSNQDLVNHGRIVVMTE